MGKPLLGDSHRSPLLASYYWYYTVASTGTLLNLIYARNLRVASWATKIADFSNSKCGTSRGIPYLILYHNSTLSVLLS